MNVNLLTGYVPSNMGISVTEYPISGANIGILTDLSGTQCHNMIISVNLSAYDGSITAISAEMYRDKSISMTIATEIMA